MRKPVFIFLSLACLAPFASGQRFTLREVPELRSEISISYRFMLPVDVSFDIKPIISPYQDRVYHNGFVLPDSSDPLAEDGDGMTSYFSYFSDDQVVTGEGGAPEALEYVRFAFDASAGANGADGESDASHGWVVDYAYKFGEAKRLAATASFGFSGVNSSTSSTITGTLSRRSFLYELSDAARLPRRENDDLFDGYLGPQERPVLPTPENPDALVPIPEEAPEGTIEEEYTSYEGTGAWDIKAGMFNVRLGPSYNLKLWKRLSLRVGAGVAGVVMDSTLFYEESIPLTEEVIGDLDLGNPVGYPFSQSDPESEDESIYVIEEVRESDFLFGGYAEADANYLISERLSAFGGFEYQSTGNFEQEAGGRSVEVDLSGQYFIKAGLGISF